MPCVTLDDKSFDAFVASASELVVVDFWAPWCGPCKMIAPALEEISGELAPAVSIVKVDIVESKAVAERFGVQSVPLLVILADGQEVARKPGAAPKGALKRWIEETAKVAD
jgi:thioredoxin 1